MSYLEVNEHIHGHCKTSFDTCHIWNKKYFTMYLLNLLRGMVMLIFYHYCRDTCIIKKRKIQHCRSIQWKSVEMVRIDSLMYIYMTALFRGLVLASTSFKDPIILLLNWCGYTNVFTCKMSTLTHNWMFSV